MKEALKLSLIALAVAGTLSACGGGGSSTADAGGGATTTTTVATTTTTTLPASTLVSMVLPATYGAATPKQAAYEHLNALRGSCGFGLLQQDARVDIAAQGHADYLATHNLIGHFEDQVNYPAGFIGTTIADRYAYASYGFSTGGEVAAMESARFGMDIGTTNTAVLMTGPYHGIAMLAGSRDIGIGLSAIGGRNRFVMNFGTATGVGRQMVAGNVVATYPCSGSTGLLTRTYADESPAPIPGRNLQTTPIGHPIYLKVRNGQNLVLTSVDLREVGAGAPVAIAATLTGSDSTGLVSNSEAIVLPNAPLNPNANYRFQATGTNNGQGFTVDFTFTTGAN